MISEAEARKLLIASCHSSAEAEARLWAELASAEFIALLVSIAVDTEDHGGDAPMQAAYYLSQAAPQLVQPHEPSLLAILETADGYGGSVALALARVGSQAARSYIERAAAEGWGGPYEEAASHYRKDSM